MERGINKRGQEGVTITTLLLIVIGAVVAVVIILGATGALDFIFDKVKIAPGQDLQAVVASCEIAANAELKADYCSTIKEVEINGVNQFVTCSHGTVMSNFRADVKDVNCVSGEMMLDEEAVKAFCKSSGKIKSGDWDSVMVNGESCMSRYGGDFNDRVDIE
jgi:hypothetical protein